MQSMRACFNQLCGQQDSLLARETMVIKLIINLK